MASRDVDGGAARLIHRRRGRRVSERPADLRDAEWPRRLEPMIQRPQRGGRPRKTDMQAAVNPILYLLRTDRPWRYLPRDHFPLRSTVYNIFRKFHRDGVRELPVSRQRL
jgi:transposase